MFVSSTGRTRVGRVATRADGPPTGDRPSPALWSLGAPLSSAEQGVGPPKKKGTRGSPVCGGGVGSAGWRDPLGKAGSGLSQLGPRKTCGGLARAGSKDFFFPRFKPGPIFLLTSFRPL